MIVSFTQFNNGLKHYVSRNKTGFENLSEHDYTPKIHV